ncbi:hypothetical protein BACFRA24663_20920 [Bacteroides fragilis]
MKTKHSLSEEESNLLSSPGHYIVNSNKDPITLTKRQSSTFFMDYKKVKVGAHNKDSTLFIYRICNFCSIIAFTFRPDSSSQ